MRAMGRPGIAFFGTVTLRFAALTSIYRPTCATDLCG